MRQLLAGVATALFVVWFSLSSSGSLSARHTLAKRLGNNAEGATLVSNGPGEARIAVIDGYDVLVVPAGGRGTAGTLLSTRRTLEKGPLVAPLGFAALPNGHYVLLDPNNSEAAIF